MKSITVEELSKNKDEYALIDVRKNHERAAGNIGGEHIPMGKLPDKVNEIPKDKNVVVYCRSGNRSGNVVQFLEGQGYDNLYNLEGGMLAWKERIDSELNVI